jgi:hypothetical protein
VRSFIHLFTYCKPTSGHLLYSVYAFGTRLQAHIGSLALLFYCYSMLSAHECSSRGVYQSDTANFTQVACAHPVFSIVRIAHPSGFRSPGSVILCLTNCTLNSQVRHTHSRVRIIYPLVYQTRLISGSLAFSAQFTFSVDFSCALPLAML